jgi:energy-coupling factor transport system permease protein
VFRAVPGTSALHRLGPATKIGVLAAATIVSLLVPEWPTLAALAVLFAVGVIAARLPLTVVPRVPWPVAAIVALGGAAAAAGGGFVLYVQSMLLTVLFFALSLLLVWTTRVEDLPAAFARVAAPLRRLGVPVSEWAHAVTFAVRTLPLLRDEFRVLIAARRLRAPLRAASRRTRARARGRELIDLLVAVVASAGRRASDLGRTATQRGGMRSTLSADRVRPGHAPSASSLRSSSGVSWKSRIAKFSSMRGRRRDRGITTKPCSTCHRRMTCAAVLPWASAISASTGLRRSLRFSGL